MCIYVKPLPGLGSGQGFSKGFCEYKNFKCSFLNDYMAPPYFRVNLIGMTI